jgi:glycerol kinase
MDAWTLHTLSGGRSLLTDPTNASRTMLVDLDTRDYDDALLSEFGVRREELPEIRPSLGPFGETDPALVGFRAPVTALIGDQQASLFGHGAVSEGSAKNTYGTGCFLLVHAGKRRPECPDGLLLTLAVDARGEPAFAIEGSVFVAGAAVQWLRDGLGLVASAEETESLAASLEGNGGVYLVPAFTGLGAPHWDPEARGLLTGITRGTTKAHVVRATLEAIAYQVHELVEHVEASSGVRLSGLRVDGGGSKNRWLMEFQAGLLGRPVFAASDADLTCRGAAMLAAIGAGLAKDAGEFEGAPGQAVRHEPRIGDRAELLRGWHRAVRRARSVLPGDEAAAEGG